MKRYFRLPFLFLSLIFVSNTAFSQTILNPSFEGPHGENDPPDNWTSCHEFSSPDTQPGFWEVTKSPSEGDSYIGLVTRGDLGPFANENEDVQTELTDPIFIGEVFKFNIDLSFSENWGHTIDFGSTFLAYDTPAKLKIFGGSNSCESTELLWESEAIDHTAWKPYLVSLSPQEIDVSFLILKADFSTESTAFGNLLIDNIEACDLGIDWDTETAICEGELLTLDVAIPNGTYEWQDGTTSSTYTIQDAGTYSVTVSNGCMSETFEIVVATRNCLCDTALPIQTMAFDSTKCHNVNIILDAETPGGSYLWSTGSNEPSIEIMTPGLYSVAVSNNCVVQTFDYSIETFECLCEISAPNVFTPNGDGINEKFEITGTPDIARYKLVVFNRAGLRVFESSQVGNYWNGTANSNELPVGVYYYSIEIMCVQGNSIIDNSYNGWVTLRR